MAIYVTRNVITKENDYANFLRTIWGYRSDEADTKIWEVEYQIVRRCIPILMKPMSSGVIKFKSVLQRQEIKSNIYNRQLLTQIINRRKSSRNGTEWKGEYIVSKNGDIFILTLEYYSPLSEQKISELLAEEKLRKLIKKTVKKIIKEDFSWFLDFLGGL